MRRVSDEAMRWMGKLDKIREETMMMMMMMMIEKEGKREKRS